MGKQKYYAVASGRHPGLYDNWPEAESQVKGYPGARYKGFTERAAAEEWLSNPVSPIRRAPVRENEVRGKEAPLPAMEGELVIYTDGGAIGNPGPGGYGVVLVDGAEEKEISGGYQETTNNRMELMACIVALRTVRGSGKKVILYSDSSYVVNGINKGWAKGWQRRNWRKSDGSAAANPDLWQELLALSAAQDVQFCWVRGHAGNPLNERCDRLAVSAARGGGMAIDQGYLRNKE